MTWRTNVVRRQTVVNGQLHSRWTGAGVIPKNAVKVGEEHREDRRRDVEGGGKDDADVPDCHLVHIGIVDNLE